MHESVVQPIKSSINTISQEGHLQTGDNFLGTGLFEPFHTKESPNTGRLLGMKFEHELFHGNVKNIYVASMTDRISLKMAIINEDGGSLSILIKINKSHVEG